MEEKEIISLLLLDIKAKKALKGVDDSVLNNLLSRYLQSNNALSRLVLYANEKQLRKSHEYRKTIKKIRQSLHGSYSVFQIPKNSEEIKKDFFKKAKFGSLTDEDYNKVLSMHLSTKERLENYQTIYENIFEVTGKPKSILDLGCGLNPFSIHFIGLKKLEYTALDIDRANLEAVQKYFELSGIKGKTILMDLKSSAIEQLDSINADICFAFKIFEIDRRIAERIIPHLKSKYLVASFSTVSVSGRTMSSPEREWFEKMLSRLNLKNETFRTENELFYIIKL